jgi:CxxC motif-containing protein (DUF1111 family)
LQSTATLCAHQTSQAALRSALDVMAPFINGGCAGCHIMNQTTGSAALIDTTANSTVSNITINPFSDFVVHNMTGLADRVSQGNANGSQFRGALYGASASAHSSCMRGVRTNLVTAIEQHASSGSEANQGDQRVQYVEYN